MYFYFVSQNNSKRERLIWDELYRDRSIAIGNETADLFEAGTLQSKNQSTNIAHELLIEIS